MYVSQRGHPVAQQKNRLEFITVRYQKSWDEFRSADGGRDIIFDF